MGFAYESRWMRAKAAWQNSMEAFPLEFNPLTPNGQYSGRTAPLTSRRYILNIYSTNIHTEYFKHAA
jgi:hypothetical protein